MHMKFLRSLTCGEKTVSQHYTVDGFGASDYPSYYGGSYINTDGNMVVLIKNDIGEKIVTKKSWYKDFCSRINSDNFVIRYISNNLCCLISTADQIVFGEIRNFLEEVSYNGMSINISENCIYVYVRNEEDVPLVKKVLKDKPCIVKVSDEAYRYTVGLYGGEGISLSNSLSAAQFSVAFRVKKTVNYSTTYGFLTCGHAFQGNNASVYLPQSETGMNLNVLIGSVSSSEQQNSGNTDAAVIRLNNNVSSYNSIFYTSTQIHAGSYISLQKGNTVYMRGKTTGVSIGVVKDISLSVTVGGDSFIDLVKTDYPSANGDSGGAVYSQPNSFNYAFAVGIQCGTITTPLGNVGSFYTKIYNAVNTLGFTLY